MDEVVEIYGEGYFENPAFKTADADAYFGYKDYLSDRENIQRRLRQVLRHVESELPVGKILDVGCGLGLFVEVAAAAGWDAWGVELNDSAVKWAQENISTNVRAGTIAELNAADGEFDCVTMFDVIEHLADSREELHEVNRVLRPGGLLVLVTPDAGALMSRAMGAHWLEMKRAPEHLQFFTVDGLARMLAVTGFESLGWHSIGKISSIKNMMADLRFYSARVVDGVEKVLEKVGLADRVIDLDPRTKLCIYARKIGEPKPLDAPIGAVAKVPRIKPAGLGRLGIRRVQN
jgi:2-polyprenyl-3-methyl-5-hydroxy-6-metoxy-1,4-benzoquinol methylase